MSVRSFVGDTWRGIAIGLVLFAIVGVFILRHESPVSDAPSAMPLESVVITLGEHGYEPREVTLYRGGTVTFRNTRDHPYWPASNLHPTHEIYSEFDPKRPLTPDEEWSFTFDRVGQHNFHDHIRAYFVGTIYVVER